MVVVQPVPHAPYDIVNSTMAPGHVHLTSLRQLPEQLLAWCPNSPELNQVEAAREHLRPLVAAAGGGPAGVAGGVGGAGSKTPPVGSPGGISGTLGSWVGFGKGKAQAAAAAAAAAADSHADVAAAEAAWGTAAAVGGGTSGGTSRTEGAGFGGSVTATALLLEAWPGPLTTSSSKDKVVAWVKERSRRGAEEEPLAGFGTSRNGSDGGSSSNSNNGGWGSGSGGRKGGKDRVQQQLEALSSMWELLGLMAKNQGQLKPQGGGKSGKAGGGGGLLLEDECCGGDPAGGGLLAMIKGEAAAWAGPGGTGGTSGTAGGVGPPGAHDLLAAIAPHALSECAAAAAGVGVGLDGFGGGGSGLLRALPSEGQMQEAAVKMQRLLLEGRRKEALQVALEGQLWAPALLLAHG